MDSTAQRERVRFRSGSDECVAWHYPGSNGGCVVMAGGFAVTKEPATDLFAGRFNDAGFSVLAFDYRRLGESQGHPRLAPRIRDGLADWLAAIGFARGLPEVDPARLAVWGFSASGGYVLSVAARDPGLAAAIAQTPLVDAPRAAPMMMRYSTPLAQIRLIGRGLRDSLGGLLGRDPLLVPLAGPRGTVALLSTPDALKADRALNGSRYPDWQQQVAARSVLALACYRPGRHAPHVRCPLLVIVCDDDRSSPPRPAMRAAARAPGAELVRLPGDHYSPFTDAHQRAVAAQLSFLQRHLLAPGPRPPLHTSRATSEVDKGRHSERQLQTLGNDPRPHSPGARRSFRN
jgi:pimeloyl-ACP methyl ester carboxylesterase